MSMLLLKFVIDLQDPSLSPIASHHGPLFHRWLPAGEQDALSLRTGDDKAHLKIWFERRGFVDDGFIRFDYNRQDVDPEIIPKQALLDGGPLMGLLEIHELPEDQGMALQRNQIGDALYIRLGRRVVNRLLHRPVANLLNILRANYGQYWIPQLEPWDSRYESLGSYCSRLNLRWSLDGGNTWTPFRPDEPKWSLVLGIRVRPSEYLAQRDWEELSRVVQERYEPSLAASLVGEAHKFVDQGKLKHALIEGVTALERAVNEFIRARLHGRHSLLTAMSSFMNLPLTTQLVSVSSILGKISAEQIQQTIQAIEMRNKVIHKGWNPPESVQVQVAALLRTVAMLLPGPRFKFPIANPGNELRSPESWEKLSEEPLTN